MWHLRRPSPPIEPPVAASPKTRAAPRPVRDGRLLISRGTTLFAGILLHEGRRPLFRHIDAFPGITVGLPAQSTGRFSRLSVCGSVVSSQACPAPGFHRPRLSMADLGCYWSTSSPFKRTSVADPTGPSQPTCSAAPFRGLATHGFPQAMPLSCVVSVARSMPHPATTGSHTISAAVGTAHVSRMVGIA